MKTFQAVTPSEGGVVGQPDTVAGNVLGSGVHVPVGDLGSTGGASAALPRPWQFVFFLCP